MQAVAVDLLQLAGHVGVAGALDGIAGVGVGRAVDAHDAGAGGQSVVGALEVVDHQGLPEGITAAVILIIGPALLDHFQGDAVGLRVLCPVCSR